MYKKLYTIMYNNVSLFINIVNLGVYLRIAKF